jgi:hypothetical protein
MNAVMALDAYRAQIKRMLMPEPRIGPMMDLASARFLANLTTIVSAPHVFVSDLPPLR